MSHPKLSTEDLLFLVQKMVQVLGSIKFDHEAVGGLVENTVAELDAALEAARENGFISTFEPIDTYAYCNHMSYDDMQKRNRPLVLLDHDNCNHHLSGSSILDRSIVCNVCNYPTDPDDRGEGRIEQSDRSITSILSGRLDLNGTVPDNS